MYKNVLDWLWRKKRFLLAGSILAGIFGFTQVVIGLVVPDWLFFTIILISVPLGITYVIFGWIHTFRGN